MLLNASYELSVRLNKTYGPSDRGTPKNHIIPGLLSSETRNKPINLFANGTILLPNMGIKREKVNLDASILVVVKIGECD